MNFQGQDPEGSKPTGARVEEDFERPLRTARSVSHRRLPAALPFAVAGILVVTSVAFGATVVRSLVSPTSSATPVVVGDDPADPTDAPTLPPTLEPTQAPVVTDAPVVTNAPTEAPTQAPTQAPTKAPVVTNPPTANTQNLGALTATDNGNGYWTFKWHAYTGSTSFTYYKLSGVAYPEAPGYAEGKGYWAVNNPDCTTATVPVKPGVWNINVEAVDYPGGKTVVIARTSVLKLTVTGTAPTAPPVLALGASGTYDPATHKVTIAWSKYTGPFFGYYGIQKGSSPSGATLAVGNQPNFYYTTNVNETSKLDGPLAPGTYYYRVYAFSELTLGVSGGVRPACNVGTFLAQSELITVVVPAATPTPATPSPSAPPVG